jgi:hypothetical protein
VESFDVTKIDRIILLEEGHGKPVASPQHQVADGR